tara:strand:+ start:4899 stop:5426 length:528 start_codon:yes stop_codon:yes gene_type:complete
MHRISKYIADTSGPTERILDIQLLRIIEEIPSKKLIKNYKISRFFKGKFFIKRLINKIFKYKINQKMQWSSDFWDRIVVLNIETSINRKTDLSNNDIKHYIKETNSKKRIKDIYRYKKLGVISPPLYIDGYSLNTIGAKIEKNRIFMLDGSRRLTATLLNRTPKNNIYLISIKPN